MLELSSLAAESPWGYALSPINTRGKSSLIRREDAPDQLRIMAQELGFTFPLCYDERQVTAKAYTAACTPDFFLFDSERRLVYRGQLDGSRPGNDKPVNGCDLRAAIDAVLAGRSVDPEQTQFGL